MPNFSVLDLLIALGADVNLPNLAESVYDDSGTPLHLGAQSGSNQFVNKLLQIPGIEVNNQAFIERYPLAYCSEK